MAADLRKPDKILDGAAATLDFTRPGALTLLGIVNFVVDDSQAHAIVERLLAALPSGSYLMTAHLTHEVDRERAETVTRRWNEHGGAPMHIRGRQELASFFEGLKVLELGSPPPRSGGPTPPTVAHRRGVHLLRRRTQA